MNNLRSSDLGLKERERALVVVWLFHLSLFFCRREQKGNRQNFAETNYLVCVHFSYQLCPRHHCGCCRYFRRQGMI